MLSRRRLLGAAALAPLPALPSSASAAPGPVDGPARRRESLDGLWEFRLDSDSSWRTVTVPHTWQIEPAAAGHYGVAWYRREFFVPEEWAALSVHLEFEAVFHSATVWINDRPAGEHLRKGYTAFRLNVAPLLRFGQRNTLRVRVDNTFDDAMLPRGRSSDWAHDGGIYRPVALLVRPPVFAESVRILAQPDLAGKADLRLHVTVRNDGREPAQGSIGFEVHDETAGNLTLRRPAAGQYSVAPGSAQTVELPAAVLDNVRLWHFDHPNLYTLRLRLASGDELAETFGVRRIEVRDGGFFLNGERVRLMGVERMAGSNPEYGMAEPASWIEHDHADMRELNCVYTRVHWPQDRRVLDYCDRHGMLIQTEVPTWGPATFAGMGAQPSEAIMRNGLEQLREMILRDRNHPSIFSWGLCNEIDGQNPPAQAFARRMYEEAKKLDPDRTATYASHSLRETPGRDVAGAMDYIMWNEYFGSWYPGDDQELARRLDDLHAAFPRKAIVMSEYGWCACVPERPEGDRARIEILRTHDRVFRERPWVAGLIFFCYNDYRTHVGDKGQGVMRQRVHGVVDVYGNRKPSYEVLRQESSPVAALEITGLPRDLHAVVRARDTVPAYRLTGYRLRAVSVGPGDIPLERFEVALPDLAPGAACEIKVLFEEKSPQRVRFDVVRPTGLSTASLVWTP